MIPRNLFLGPARAQALASRPLTKPGPARLNYAPALRSPAGPSSFGVTARALGTRGQLPPGNSPGGRPALQPSSFGTRLRRWETTATGDEKSGHICAGPNETIVFYDNLFPLKLSYGWMSYLVGRPWGADQDLSNLLQRFNKSSLGIADPINLVKRGIPKDDSLVRELFFCRFALGAPSSRYALDCLSRLVQKNAYKNHEESYRNHTSTEGWRSVRKIQPPTRNGIIALISSCPSFWLKNLRESFHAQATIPSPASHAHCQCRQQGPPVSGALTYC